MAFTQSQQAVGISFRLKKEIKGTNLEINQDEKSVSEKIRRFGFDEKYEKFLNEIEKFINTETSDIVNSGMIGNLRSFMESLFTDIAKKIASDNNEEIPKVGDGPMGDIRKYIKIQLELSGKDNSFINGFIDVLREGGHSFTANREYFRLSRNIAIEIALLILTKYEKRFHPN